MLLVRAVCDRLNNISAVFCINRHNLVSQNAAVSFLLSM